MTDPMAKVVWSPIGHVEPETLVVIDADRRTYAGLSRDGSRYHLIQPTAVGRELVCTCVGATYRGDCYQLRLARRLEGHVADADPGPAWLPPAIGLDNPAGAGELVEAARG